MSQIHYHSITLEEMVSGSSIIVTARQMQPFTSTVTIPLEKKNHEGKLVELPPYEKFYRHFEVTKILKDPMKEVKKGPVAVAEAHFENSLDLHIEYHLEGLARSPEYRSYNGEKDVSDLAEAILFLHCFDELSFAFDFSWESIDRIKEVKKFLNKNRKEKLFKRRVRW